MGPETLCFLVDRPSLWVYIHAYVLVLRLACHLLLVYTVCAVSVFTARCYAFMVLTMALCLSATDRSSTKTAEWIKLVFGLRASFHPSYTVLKGNSVISKNKGISLWNFVLKSWLRKFRHGISIDKTCYQLSSRKVDAQSVINWAVVGQISR